MIYKWKPSKAAKAAYAWKMRIMEIYNDIAAGYTLDGHGNRKDG